MITPYLLYNPTISLVSVKLSSSWPKLCWNHVYLGVLNQDLGPAMVCVEQTLSLLFQGKLLSNTWRIHSYDHADITTSMLWIGCMHVDLMTIYNQIMTCLHPHSEFLGRNGWGESFKQLEKLSWPPRPPWLPTTYYDHTMMRRSSQPEPDQFPYILNLCWPR